MQWLDAVAQVMRQFPTAFEFKEELLVFLADHVFSGLFGTFLVNFDRQRQLIHKLESRTLSIWSYVFDHAASFTSGSYRRAGGALWPSWHAHRIRVWERYYLRWDPEMHPPAATGEVWEDDTGARYLENPSDLGYIYEGRRSRGGSATEVDAGPPQPPTGDRNGSVLQQRHL